MAEELCTTDQTCVGVSSSSSFSADNWDLRNPSSHSSAWNNVITNPPWISSDPYYSNSSCEEDISGLSVDSSRELAGETAASDNHHFWSHLLLTGVQLPNGGDVAGENFLDALSLKTHSSSSPPPTAGGMFQLPACDYLKKMDDGWELSSSSPPHHFHNQLHQFGRSFDMEKKEKPSNSVVCNWSIAPPGPEASSYHLELQTTAPVGGSSSSSSMDRHFARYGHGREVEASSGSGGDFVQRPSCTTSSGFGSCQYGSIVRDSNGCHHGHPGIPFTNDARKFSDVASFSNGILSSPVVDDYNNGTTTSFMSFDLSAPKNQGLQNSTSNSAKNNEGKKKKADYGSGTVLKKAKRESSVASSVKMQAPKVKLSDKVTGLQQIVSPFGKTDTASVLLETIGYIRFLQEQVQMLSDAYTKTKATASRVNKGSWGLDGKDKGDVKHDLKSRGLCLAPVSSAPQFYRENSSGSSDYWTTTYRGSLYG